MILNTLNLHNFMSYGDCKLDLTSISVACLTGTNGAGKSAILDAVTWSLWECARASSDELIRSGQTNMYVDITFTLENNRYRVRRSRQRTFPRAAAKPLSKSSLDFQIWQVVGADGKWASLTGNSIRETQVFIADTIRMDYDTFINSVYLRQGRADEFTMRAPGERKQVLGEILGLSYFDKLQAKSIESSKGLKAKIDSLQATLQANTNLADSQAQLQSQLVEAQEALEHNNEAIGITTAELAGLTTTINELANLDSQLEPSQTRLEELQQDIAGLTKNRIELTIERDRGQTIIDQADHLSLAAAEFQATKEKVERLDEISFIRQELEKRKLESKAAAAAIRGRLEVESEHLALRLTEFKERHEKLNKDLQQQDKIEQDHQKYRKLLSTETAMSAKQETFVQLTNRADRLNTSIIETRMHLEAELLQKSNALKELTSLVQNKSSIDAEHANLVAQAETLDRLEVEFVHVEESGLRIKQEIDLVTNRTDQLKRQISDNHAKVHELQSAHSLTTCPLCAASIIDRHAVLQRYSIINEQLSAEIEHHNNESSKLEDQRRLLRQRYLDLRRQLDQRKGLDTRIGEYNARQSAIKRADENCNQLTNDVLKLENQLAQQQYAVVERESLINIKGEIHKLDFDPVAYTSLQAQLRAQRHAEVRYQQLIKDREQAAKLCLEVPALEKHIRLLQRQLANEDYAQDARTAISNIDSQLADYDYDGTEHQQLRARLNQLLAQIERFQELESAKIAVPVINNKLLELAAHLDNKTSQYQALETSMQAARIRLTEKTELLTRAPIMDQKLQELLDKKGELSKEITILETKLEQQARQHEQLEAVRSQIDDLLVQMNDYDYLAESFGKKGIQAIIIENAVPEIEAEANHILSRLSDNSMHIGLITQHRTRQGNLQETLDIVIADGLGTRNYELYSGGEAFKINFAIRIALSRLLARRAGAKLQTLFIDEGFGSQDEVSRHRLMQAINAIKPSFARILVVTHIAEIKELFPVQIQVEKGDGISSLNIIHGG